MGMYQKGLGETLEESEKLLNDFFDAFPKVKAYLDRQVIDAMTRGYTQDAYGRVRWYEVPSRDEAEEDEINRIQKRIKRQAQNHTIQSLSASVTKLAILHLYKWLRDNDIGYMILTIHDSIFFEIKEDKLESALPKIKEIMESAGPLVLPKLITPIDFDIGAIITKKCKISGLPFDVYEYIWDSKAGLQKNPQQLSEETDKALKFMNIPITEDYMGILNEIIEKLPTTPVEWQDKNEKWIKAVKKSL